MKPIIQNTNTNPSNELGCYFFSGKTHQHDSFNVYLSAYQLWKSVWEDTFEELKGVRKIYSDDFLRQDEIIVLTANAQTVGVFLLSWLDLNHPVERDRHYFSSYPHEVIQHLIENGHHRIMTMGYLTVHPKWRRTVSGPLVSEVLLGLATKRYLNTKATALIAFTRNNRKINDLVYRHGAIPLKEKCTEHNVEVDIICVYRENVKATPVDGIPQLVNQLWDNRTAVNHLEKENEKIFQRKHQKLVSESREIPMDAPAKL